MEECFSVLYQNMSNKSGSSWDTPSTPSTSSKSNYSTTPTRRTVYRIVESGVPVNMESHHRRPCNRGTGHLGTGLYVYLSPQTLPRGRGAEGRRSQLEHPWPWQSPFVIRSGQETRLMVIHELGRLLCRASRPLTVEYVQDHLAWRRLPLRFRNAALWNEAIEWARNRGDGVQPLNYVMQQLGYDGIVNYHADANAMGSVVYNPPSEWLTAVEEPHGRKARIPRKVKSGLKD